MKNEGARQLVLPLPSRPALGRSDFFVSPANCLALAQIDAWPDWPDRRIAVAGPEASGKTHLAHVWASRSGARILSAEALARLDPASVDRNSALVVEDADLLAGSGNSQGQEVLFHLCNRLLMGGGSLMVSGREAPAHWGLELPDLASRLGTAGVARLETPDDRLLGAVLVKLFADRQIDIAQDLVQYLLLRMDRSFAAAEMLVLRLDREALAQRRPVTVRLASELFRAGTSGL